MSHDYHRGHPNYSPSQLLHDGCRECASRGMAPLLAIEHMDVPTWNHAWNRALVWHQRGLTDLADAELPLLSLLWTIYLKMSQAGLPVAVCVALAREPNPPARPYHQALTRCPGCGSARGTWTDSGQWACFKCGDEWSRAQVGG